MAARDTGLRAWRTLFEDATPIDQLRPRHPAVCVGVVERIRFVPGESVEAILTDGSGRLRAVWTGQGVMRGLELGAGLRVAGTFCVENDVPTVRNPSWCLVADPYACSADWAAKARELRDEA